MKEFNVGGDINNILNVLHILPQDAEVVAEVGDFGPVISYEIANCFHFNDWGDNELGLYSSEEESGRLYVAQVISEIEKTSASKLILSDNYFVTDITQIDTKDELMDYLQRHLGAGDAEWEFSEITEAMNKFPLVVFDV